MTSKITRRKEEKSPSSGSAADGLHAIMADDHGDHRVWSPHGEQSASTAFLIPRDGHFLWRIRSALGLHRLLGSQSSGQWPREQRLTRFQFHQASLMLRAWDGVQSGATRRHVASVILNPDVATLRALDRKNAPVRRRLARILKAARETIDGGGCTGLFLDRDGRESHSSGRLGVDLPRVISKSSFGAKKCKRYASPGAVGPASRLRRRFADAPAAALLTGLGVAVGPASRPIRAGAMLTLLRLPLFEEDVAVAADPAKGAGKTARHGGMAAVEQPPENARNEKQVQLRGC